MPHRCRPPGTPRGQGQLPPTRVTDLLRVPPNMVLSPLRPQVHSPRSCTRAQLCFAPGRELHLLPTPCQAAAHGAWPMLALQMLLQPRLPPQGRALGPEQPQQAGSYVGSSLEGPLPFRKVHAKMELRIQATALSQ